MPPGHVPSVSTGESPHTEHTINDTGSNVFHGMPNIWRAALLAFHTVVALALPHSLILKL